MQYALGNFTKFVKGSKPHFASVCFRIDFIDSTWNRRCLFASIALKDPAWTPNDLYLDHARDPSIAPVDLYLLRPSKYWDSD